MPADADDVFEPNEDATTSMPDVRLTNPRARTTRSALSPVMAPNQRLVKANANTTAQCFTTCC